MRRDERYETQGSGRHGEPSQWDDDERNRRHEDDRPYGRGSSSALRGGGYADDEDYGRRRADGDAERHRYEGRDDRRRREEPDEGLVERIYNRVRSWLEDDDGDRDRRRRSEGRSYPSWRERGGGFSRHGHEPSGGSPRFGEDPRSSYSGYGFESRGGSDYGRDEGRGRERYGREGYGGERYGRERGGERSGEHESSRRWAGGGREAAGSEYEPYRSWPSASYTYAEFWLTPGPHQGVGPRGYQRSGDRIKEEVCDRLERHGQLDASEIEVEIEDGEVKLTGTVEDRATKRMAEEVAESVHGVHDVQNMIKVKRRGERREGQHESQESRTESAGSPGRRRGTSVQ